MARPLSDFYCQSFALEGIPIKRSILWEKPYFRGGPAFRLCQRDLRTRRTSSRTFSALYLDRRLHLQGISCCLFFSFRYHSLGLFRIERFDQRNPASADRMLSTGSDSGHQSRASEFHQIQSENNHRLPQSPRDQITVWGLEAKG